MYEIKPLSKENFQYVKGIAILSILVSHIGDFSGKTWFTPLGGIGVAIFLFCSGFGVMTSYHQKGLMNFWKNRFFTVWIPFALVEAVAAIIYNRPATDVIKELFFVKVVFPYFWYLQYLAVCYLLFYIGMRWIKNIRIRFSIWFGIALLSFIFMGNLQGEQVLSYLLGLFIAETEHRGKL